MTLLQEAAASLSSARLNAFRGAEDPNDMVLGRYLWNVSLAEALHPTIQFLEVSLRNAFHGAIAMMVGPKWYEMGAVVVNDHARVEIGDAKKKIEEAGHAVDPPRVIAALDLGFWAGLCNRQYEQGPQTDPAQITLWPTLMKDLGPLLPNELRTRRSLSEFLGRARIIRNRAYHHEPIWLGHNDRHGVRVPLSVDHRRMQQVVETLSPPSAALMRICDRFPEVFDRGPVPWVDDVRRYCKQVGIDP